MKPTIIVIALKNMTQFVGATTRHMAILAKLNVKESLNIQKELVNEKSNLISYSKILFVPLLVYGQYRSLRTNK
jgi:hypothetical protein